MVDIRSTIESTTLRCTCEDVAPVGNQWCPFHGWIRWWEPGAAVLYDIPVDASSPCSHWNELAEKLPLLQGATPGLPPLLVALKAAGYVACVYNTNYDEQWYALVYLRDGASHLKVRYAQADEPLQALVEAACEAVGITSEKLSV